MRKKKAQRDREEGRRKALEKEGRLVEAGKQPREVRAVRSESLYEQRQHHSGVMRALAVPFKFRD
jgi:hypothetical protein